MPTRSRPRSPLIRPDPLSNSNAAIYNSIMARLMRRMRVLLFVALLIAFTGALSGHTGAQPSRLGHTAEARLVVSTASPGVGLVRMASEPPTLYSTEFLHALKLHQLAAAEAGGRVLQARASGSKRLSSKLPGALPQDDFQSCVLAGVHSVRSSLSVLRPRFAPTRHHYSRPPPFLA